MDSTSSEGSSTTVSMNKRSTELTVELRQKNIPKARHATNKSWIIFFIVIFTSWIASCYDVIYYGTGNGFYPASTTFSDHLHRIIRKKAIENSIRDYSEVPTNITEFFINEIANMDNITAEILKEEKRLKQELEPLHFIFLVYTCNPSKLRNLSEFKEKDLVIMGHVFLSFAYFVYAITNLRYNKIIGNQSWIVVTSFVFVAFLEHLSAAVWENNSITLSSFPTNKRLALWLIPEMIFLIILSSQLFSSIRTKKSGDSNVDDEIDSGNESDNDLDNDFNSYSQRRLNDDIIPISTYIPAIVIGFPIILILRILMMFTMTVLYKTHLLDGRSYIIVIGSIYVCRTIFCFGQMLASYASSLVNKDNSSSICSSLGKALFVVTRYHLGTACYHATLIFPKWSASSVMSESGWKPLIKGREKKEFRVKYGKIFKLSRTLTAVHGTNHSQSIKNLLRLYCRDLITKKSFPGFKPLSKSLLAFLLATNCILIILLWTIGVVDDDFAMAAWVMYVKIAFVFSLAIAFFTSTMDAIKLSEMRKVLENFSDEELYKEVVLLTATEDQLSDDEQSV